MVWDVVSTDFSTLMVSPGKTSRSITTYVCKASMPAVLARIRPSSRYMMTLIPKVWQCTVTVYPSPVNVNGNECAPNDHALNSYTLPLWMSRR